MSFVPYFVGTSFQLVLPLGQAGSLSPRPSRLSHWPQPSSSFATKTREAMSPLGGLMPFSKLGLKPSLVQATREMRYTEPTPIQAEAIPAILSERDLIATAQTGTGK